MPSKFFTLSIQLASSFAYGRPASHFLQLQSNHMMKKILLSLPVITALLAAPFSVNAAIVYEGFSDADATALAGQTADLGLGAWTSASGSAASNSAGSLDGSGLTTTGNKVTFTGASAYYANLSLPITVGADSTYDLWGSFLMTTSGTSGDAALSVFHSSSPDTSTPALASFGLINNLNVRVIAGRTMSAGGNNGLGTSTTAVNQLNFYVFKITINTNAGQVETASLWLNPTLSAGMTEASLGSSALSNVDLTNTGDGAISSIGLYSSGPGVTFDEIRLGTSVADITPVPEPSTMALYGGLVVFGLVCYRRRCQ
jgi:hypothetical protein